MAKALTPIAIANLRARPQRYEISDGGCSGLRVVVFPSKKKSFIVRYRFRGAQRKLTLGPCLIDKHDDQVEPDSTPEIDTPLTLVAARELAARARRQAKAKNGTDPAAAKRRQREEELAAESDTLRAISEEYLRRRGAQLRTVDQRRSDLELLCASPLGRLPVAEVRRGQYTRLLDRIADERGPMRADRVLSALKTLLSWHAERSDFVSPLGRGGRRTSTSERARSRVLSDDELRRLWTTAETYPGPFGAFLQFVLLTATRRGEAAGLRRSELSDNRRTWIIPAARYKSGKDTLVPLSEAAQKIVSSMPVVGDFVFTADGRHALGGFGERKTDFDEACGVKVYRLHDLRRTSRTLLSRAGISVDIGERCLGHVIGGVRGTYDRYEYQHEKAQAFEALAAKIESIVYPPEPGVTDLEVERRRRRK
jgi:integrase